MFFWAPFLSCKKLSVTLRIIQRFVGRWPSPSSTPTRMEHTGHTYRAATTSSSMSSEKNIQVLFFFSPPQQQQNSGRQGSMRWPWSSITLMTWQSSQRSRWGILVKLRDIEFSNMSSLCKMLFFCFLLLDIIFLAKSSVQPKTNKYLRWVFRFKNVFQLTAVTQFVSLGERTWSSMHLHGLRASHGWDLLCPAARGSVF